MGRRGQNQKDNRMNPEPGIYPGVTFKEYQSWPYINASFLTTLSNKTPYHAKYDQEHPSDTPALRFGRAFHSFLMERSTFDSFWAVIPECDRRTRDGKALYETFTASRGAREEITAKDLAEIERLTTIVKAQQCHELVCGGRSEVCIVWDDPATGERCKRRLDYEKTVGFNHCITDLKTTASAAEWEFAGSIAKYGYALAAAFSIDGWRQVTGDDSLYSLLAVEKEYGVAKVWQPGERTIAAGRRQYEQAMEIVVECRKTGIWPAYGDKADMIEAPEWYLQRFGIGPESSMPPLQIDAKYVAREEPVGGDEIDDFLNGGGSQ